MNTVYIGLGSNIGDREDNIRLALRRMEEVSTSIEVSSFYYFPAMEMAPGHEQEFVNAVALLRTGLGPVELLSFFNQLEKETGRERSEHYKLSRKIDIDILLFNDSIIAEKQLQVPHPRMTQRLFVLLPLAELNSQLIIPGTGQTVSEVRDNLQKKPIPA